MIENYGLDRMASYQIENIPDTTKVVNPEHRVLEREIRSKAATLSRRTAEFGSLELTTGEKSSPKVVEAQIQKRATLHEQIDGLKEEIAGLKQKRRALPRHIPMSDLPADQKLERLSVGTSPPLFQPTKAISFLSVGQKHMSAAYSKGNEKRLSGGLI
jgi:hypothetical protein